MIAKVATRSQLGVVAVGHEDDAPVGDVATRGMTAVMEPEVVPQIRAMAVATATRANDKTTKAIPIPLTTGVGRAIIATVAVEVEETRAAVVATAITAGVEVAVEGARIELIPRMFRKNCSRGVSANLN